MKILSIVCIIGISQVTFLLIFLSFKKSTLKKNIITPFYGLLIVFLISLIWIICYEQNSFEKFWYLIETAETAQLVYGPLLLFFMKSQFDHNFKIKTTNFFHFVPALIYFLLFSPLFFRSSTLNYLDSLNFEVPIIYDFPLKLESFIYIILWRVHVFIYMIILFKFLTSYMNKIRNIPNKQTNVRIVEYRIKINMILILTYALTFIVGISDLVANAFFNIDFKAYHINISLLVLLIFIINYLIFLDLNILLKPIDLIKRKYYNLAKVDLELLDKDLEELMFNKKVYLDSNLTLAELAKLLSLSTHQLSEYFNTSVGQSFKEYLNKIRINHAKNMLLGSENEKYSLEGIANKSGFKSPATFHRNFKKHIGDTPSNWLNNKIT